MFRTDDNLALQRLVAAGYGHACLDRLGASGAVERVREDRMQRVLVPGPRLRRAWVYPGEEGYQIARNQ